MSIVMNKDREWLRQRAEAEDGCIVSVGGWVSDLAQAQAAAVQPASSPPKVALVRLLQLVRRERQLTLDQFAREVDVDAGELLRVEKEEHYLPAPRTVHKLAEYLKLPELNLMALAGQVRPKDARLSEAATRFAARSEPVRKLTKEEHEALEEFVRVLGER